MKYFLLILLFSFQAQAQLTITSHDNSAVFKYEISDSDLGQSLGALTIKALEQHTIPYQGSEQGLNSVFNSPNGLDAMVVISDFEMKAYGWCFELNGLIPEVYPDEILIESKSDQIDWFWGYAHYQDGVWIGQCLRD